MKTLRTYSLNNFPVYHTAVLPILIMFYVVPSSYLSYDGSLYLWLPFLYYPFSPQPASGNSHKSHLFFSEFGGDFFVFLGFYLTENMKYEFVFLSDLLHLAWCLQDSPTVSQMVGFPHYLWLNYTHSTFLYVFIHSSITCHLKAVVNNSAVNRGADIFLS